MRDDVGIAGFSDRGGGGTLSFDAAPRIGWRVAGS